MKNLIIKCIIICFFILNLGVVTTFATNCRFNDNSGVNSQLKECMKGTNLVQEEADITGNFKTAITSWTQSIALYLGIAAVFAIVYASAMMTLSAGDDEKINKAKNILKWSIFGLLGVMFAAAIITLVINIVYGIKIS